MAANKGKKPRKIRINRINPDNITPIHVNDMTTSHTESEFYLTFSELEPPVILEESELDELESIDVLTKLKLVITPDFARAIIKTLSENIATFEKKAKGSDGE